MPNVLICSPYNNGHRQVSVFVLALVLKEFGFKIYITYTEKQKVTNSIYINKLKEYSNTEIIGASQNRNGSKYIYYSEFPELQNRSETDLTFFKEADEQISLLVSKICKKLLRFLGQLADIILRPFYFYI